MGREVLNNKRCNFFTWTYYTEGWAHYLSESATKVQDLKWLEDLSAFLTAQLSYFFGIRESKRVTLIKNDLLYVKRGEFWEFGIPNPMIPIDIPSR